MIDNVVGTVIRKHFCFVPNFVVQLDFSHNEKIICRFVEVNLEFVSSGLQTGGNVVT